MASPSDKLADALRALHSLQSNGIIAIRSADLSRTHRERLVQNGFLDEVMKGWYTPTRPDETLGDSTAWYAAFWPFCAAYLNQVKGDEWCLSPEQSVMLHAQNWTVPKQLLVRAVRARNNITTLPHGTSLLDVRANLPKDDQIIVKENLRLFSLPTALIACSPQIYQQNPTDMRAALSVISDASEVLSLLLEGGHSTIAGRLAGAFRNIGRQQIANEIIQTMRTAGYYSRETDPFEAPSILTFSKRAQSTYVNRIQLMWQMMRNTVIANFPPAPSQMLDHTTYMRHIEDVYVTDAYHSLSIEGYRVTPELIERVRSGDWNPEHNNEDRDKHNALAARGYWQAYQAVRRSVEKVLRGENPGEVADNDHRIWYREMFAPGVAAGLHKPSDLAGYRNAPAFIRRSKHVPPSREAVRDAMPAFFELLEKEQNPAVRVVLGHFIFVYIHPYMDGNGRTGRFLMNTMLASGGYPWTIVPLEKRNEYMEALEEASTNQNIESFTRFLGSLVAAELKGENTPRLPN